MTFRFPLIMRLFAHNTYSCWCSIICPNEEKSSRVFPDSLLAVFLFPKSCSGLPEMRDKNHHWCIYHQCQLDFIYRGYSNVWSEYDFYFIEWSEKMYISWVLKARMKYTFFHFTRRHEWNIHFFTSRDEIKVLFMTNIWIFFLLYTSLSIEEMQILHLQGEVWHAVLSLGGDI